MKLKMLLLLIGSSILIGALYAWKIADDAGNTPVAGLQRTQTDESSRVNSAETSNPWMAATQVAASSSVTPEEPLLVNETVDLDEGAKAYLKFSQRIEEIFSAGLRGTITPEESAALQKQVGEMLDNQYMLRAEAYNVKMGLLLVEHRGKISEAKLDELNAWAEAKFKEIEAKSDPKNDPRYLAWVKAQEEITDRVLASNHVPHGLTREEYLIQELNKANAQIYGSVQ